MTIKKAKSVLGLRCWTNNLSTREDIETSYNELIRHYQEKGKQDLIEITNSAKKLIDEIMPPNSNGVLGDYIKIKYLNEIDVELEYIEKISHDDTIFQKYFITEFKSLLLNFKITLRECKLFDLDKEENNYLDNYYKTLNKYACKITEKTKIEPFKVEYDGFLSLNIFREVMINHFSKLLEPILDEFKQIEDYEFLKDILSWHREIASLALLWGKTDISNAQKVLRKHCWKAVNSYYKRKKLLEELIEYEGEVTPNIQELYNNILDEEAFYNIYNKLPKPSILKRVLAQKTKIKRYN